ncbi:hypothetical protein N7468_010322 [Penicillium chermesinum]|uniref:Complex 1 LYR protein domain-containing protein n=1 Tax=Penicillium chermesinum TaxID=63820 RepID=A0A9W9NE91_9EURO|nr:uncharacterized protein N7468_010322 [Penicillium chermesinum]KAJ5217314.1 hypothetical protein N7468_010322 [Penicillium chermesinum]KAJ6171075.1 hypothetical protein N7470_000142 [Penicillium chermesinum]
MHQVVVPKKSGIHRFACLALYRALLRQCSKSASDNNAPWARPTKTLVRQRFRKYKNLQSPSQVQNALNAGYKTFDLLESASRGNADDAQKITDILAQAKAAKVEKAARLKEYTELKPVPPLSRLKLRKQKSIQAQEATQRRHPNATPVLDRPHRVISGKRRVPFLVNARGVPFLRFKKPQPRNLSGVIRNLLAKRWRKLETRTRLSEEVLFAEDEEAWDRLTLPTSSKSEEPSWSTAIHTSIQELNHAIRVWDERRGAMAEKMWNVVLQERELAEKEEKQRQAEEQNQVDPKNPTGGIPPEQQTNGSGKQRNAAAKSPNQAEAETFSKKA